MTPRTRVANMSPQERRARQAAARKRNRASDRKRGVRAGLDGYYWTQQQRAPRNLALELSSSDDDQPVDLRYNPTEDQRRLRERYRQEHEYRYRSDPEEQDQRSERAAQTAVIRGQNREERLRQSAERSERASAQNRTPGGRFAKKTPAKPRKH